MAEIKTKRPAPRRVRKDAGSPTPVGPTGGMDTSSSTCGHDGCGRMCNVRYVGPTSHINDHHIIHAARGVANVWVAAIVAGLAVVLTGAIAYSSVQAAPASPTQTLIGVSKEIQAINKRLDKIESSLRALTGSKSPLSCTDTCKASGGTTQAINACLARCSSVPTTTSTQPLSCREQCKQKIEGSFVGSAQDTQKQIDQCIKTTCAPPETTGSTPGTTSTAPTPTSTMTSCLQKCGEQADACLKAADDSATQSEVCVKTNASCRDACKAPTTAQ